MAYLDLAQQLGGPARIDHAFPVADIVPAARDLTQLEWAVVAMARHDGRASVRAETRFGRIVRAIFGFARKNELSNTRLEALRRMAVLLWHHGAALPSSELPAFLAAGFSSQQFELLRDRVVAVRPVRPRRFFA